MGFIGRIQKTPNFFLHIPLMYMCISQMMFVHFKTYEDWFWEENRSELIQGAVDKVDAKAKMLSLSAGEKRPLSKVACCCRFPHSPSRFA
jgi:hypothetical protein